MTLFNRIFLRINKSSNLRNVTNLVPALKIPDKYLPDFYTNESNPAYHNANHWNKIYTIPLEYIPTLFSHHLSIQYRKQIKAFNEMGLLIRTPTIEILNCLAKTDYTKPVNKYLLYGHFGSGKSSILLHMLHYGYATNKVIVYLNQIPYWFKKPKEVKTSELIPNSLDLPIDAADWLTKFKILNNDILSQANISISKDYSQELQYSFQQGTPLIELINFGIDRSRFACDMVFALMSELKQASTAGKCNVLVLIDGFNAFFSNYTEIKNAYKKLALASEITLIQAFLDMTKSDWCNGQIIVTIDKEATKNRQESYFPRYLLTNEGFDHFDPFLPILVENYSENEFYTILEYYKYKKWIRDITPKGEIELKLLSDGNPYKLMDICKHL